LAVLDRLPGIYVDPVLPPERPTLPPMDIAAFVGFAQRGPCHRAIAVDSVAAFEACFGGDLSLARSDDGSGWTKASLPLTVRAFFGNGGRRCWVVRLARNPLHEDAWAKKVRRDPVYDHVASANRFSIPGVLCRLPDSGGGSSSVAPAFLDASSVGSWSDSMEVRARLVSSPVAIDGATKVKWGMRFTDPGTLEIGAMIELRNDNDDIRQYARILRRNSDDIFAIWCSSFARTSASRDLDNEHGSANLFGEGDAHPAKLSEGVETQLTFDGDPPATFRAGSWLRFSARGEVVWMQVRHRDGRNLFGDAWQQIAPRIPRKDFSARRFGIEIDYVLNGNRQSLGVLSPAVLGPSSLSPLIDDDGHYATARPRLARARSALCLPETHRAAAHAAWGSAESAPKFGDMALVFGTSSFTRAHRNALRAVWLPLGLAESASSPALPIIDARPRLARDGLSQFDLSLFVDPHLAGSESHQIDGQIVQRRDQQEAQLLGIHAAADISDAAFGIPSILAVPDAAQTKWMLESDSALPGPPVPGFIDRSDWRTHRSGCQPRDAAGGVNEGPDYSNFLDCTTQQLQTPTLIAPTANQPTGNFMLRWESDVPSATFVLEESSDAGFAGAARVYAGAANRVAITNRAEGAYYYRLRVENGPNTSEWTAAAVLVRASDYRAAPAGSDLANSIHVATLRLAAGTGDMFALLAYPEGLQAKKLSRAVAELRTLAPGYGGALRLGRNEQRALSFGAVHHPWLLYRTDRTQAPTSTELGSTPPLGCIAGLMAITARRRGAWIAHANVTMADIIGLSPSMPGSEQLPLYLNRANMVRRTPSGFMLMDNDTLSDDQQWKQITTRRLMILLRRLVVERGNIYVFEPHSDILRRAIENDLSSILDDLQRRGAFAGATSRESWVIQVDSQSDNADHGMLVVEIGVAPSIPMRFVTLRLLQQDGRMTLAEEAA
jgi:hypothetical protein